MSVKIEQFEMEYLDYLVSKDFDENKNTFSEDKINKVESLMLKIEEIRREFKPVEVTPIKR